MTFDLERMAILHGRSYLLSVGVVFLFVNYRAGQSLYTVNPRKPITGVGSKTDFLRLIVKTRLDSVATTSAMSLFRVAYSCARTNNMSSRLIRNLIRLLRIAAAS